MPLVEALNRLVGIGTLAMLLALAALVCVLFLRRRIPDLEDIAQHVRRWGLWIGLKLSLLSVLFALYYSDVLGFEPCPLCWWQRIFLFPQVLLFALALRTRDARVAAYSIAFSIPGLAVALYQHALQVMPSGSLPCPATSVSCAQRVLFEFGFITFPLVAAVVFALLIVTMLFVRESR